MKFIKEHSQNNKTDYLMAAYIAFLLIVIVYRVICIKTGHEFENWQRIVMAVTTSTYFFSLADFHKSLRDLEQNKKDKNCQLTEQLLTYKNIIEASDEDAEGLKTEILNQIDAYIQRDEDDNKNSDKKIKNNNTSYGAFSILGFLVFFLVSNTDFYPVDNISLDIYTMCAFFMMLFTDFIYSICNTKANAYFNNRYNSFNALIEKQETNNYYLKVLKEVSEEFTEDEDGQAENGD